MQHGFTKHGRAQRGGGCKGVWTQVASLNEERQVSIRTVRTILVCAVLVAAACGGSDRAAQAGDKAAPATGKKITIVMIAKSEANAVFVAARKGANDAAAEISRKGGAEVVLDWQTPAQEDAAEQLQKVRAAVASHADAILISCSDATTLTPAIDEAVSQGVEVMTFDSDAPQSKRFSFYGVDDVKTGAAVMSELATVLGGKGAVAILAGNPDASNLKNRARGVQDQAALHPGIKVVGVYTHVETPRAATAAVLKAQRDHPEIKGWAMVGAWPLFTSELLGQIPAGTKIVAVDALPAELVYLDRGFAPVLLAQPVYQWGYVGVQSIVDHLAHKPVPARIPMELVRVTRQNMGEWARQLKSWGFMVPAAYLTP